MMKKTILISLLALVLLAGTLHAQPGVTFDKQTFLFAEKDGQQLYLDKYGPVAEDAERPCIIFVFGGAFARGARDVEKYIPYFDYLVQHGYTVVSIDYRLGLREISQRRDATQQEFVTTFIHTVDMAVEDLYDATNFVLQHAAQWNIDPAAIVLNGSSAGAVTVLQGEYVRVNGIMSSGRLPDGFRYAGVIAFAGAIFTPEGTPRWSGTPAPLMMFHGNADLQVPYDQLTYEGAGLYGADYIAAMLDQEGYPYHFYSFDDYGHQIASDPMQNNKEDILAFLNTFVKGKKPYQIRTRLREIGRPEVPKNFTFEDYVKGNFGG